MPKVSAVMALYNTPFEYFEKTLASILNQTFEDFELIIVDDCSTIDYSQYLKNRDERIKYIKLEQNKGPGYARNYAMKLSQGEYIAICDSDDVYENNRFELQINYLDKHSDISLLGGAFRLSNSSKIRNTILSDEDIKVNLIFNSQFANPIVMFRKNDFVENNLFYDENLKFAEDYKLWLEAAFSNLKMANLPEVLMTYTRRKGQLSKEKRDIQTSILKDMYLYILKNLNISEKFVQTIQKIENSDYSTLTIDEINCFFEELKNTNKFDKNALETKQTEIINNMQKLKTRLLKIKIGNNNLCLSKNFRLYIEKRD